MDTVTIGEVGGSDGIDFWLYQIIEVLDCRIRSIAAIQVPQAHLQCGRRHWAQNLLHLRSVGMVPSIAMYMSVHLDEFLVLLQDRVGCIGSLGGIVRDVRSGSVSGNFLLSCLLFFLSDW